MFNNLLKFSLRSLKRQRSYLIINILGLSIGIACSLLIALFVINESGYDRYNVKKERIYRLILNGKIGGQEIVGAYTPAVMGPTLVNEFPEVENYLRLNGRGPSIIEFDGQTFTEDHIVEADSTFFDFFSIPLIKGNIDNLLDASHKAVITESLSKRIFGDADPIDKAIKLGTDSVRYIITGVMADVPDKTHFEASILVSFLTNDRVNDPTWLSNSFSTYLLLKENSSFETVESKFPALLVKYVGPELQRLMGVSITDFESQGNVYGFYLQNLKDIHLDPSIEQQFKEPSDPKYLLIFGSIAILILLIASINFMNLSTAQASKRTKEVGIKKISGSSRSMLITQFLSESFVLAFLSLIIALFTIKLTLPYFNNLLGTQISLNLFSEWYILPVLLLFSVFVAILSGSYPAFFLSSFSPYEVLKGSIKNNLQNGRLRKVLVVFQFTISILLIVGTMIMYRQIRFMLNKDVGFSKEQLIVINRAGAVGNRVKSFKEAVRGIPGVINIASSTAVPGRNNNNNGYMMEGRKDETFLMQTNYVDYDYLETYGMTLASGRGFNETFSTDTEGCVINEAAQKEFNVADIESARFLRPSGNDGTLQSLQVLGVVKDFNFESLRNPIGPYIFCFKYEYMNYGYLTVKLDARNYTSTITEIEKIWKEFTGNAPLQYYFVDDDFEQMYIQEKQNAQLAVIFSALALFIAALGLFGLTSFTVEQRTKEIGVRKAMGSSIAEIYMVISKEVFVLIGISALIAWPVVYYFASSWLENFYYRINVGFLSLLAGLLIAAGIAIITISYKILKAARINPAYSLKYE